MPFALSLVKKDNSTSTLAGVPIKKHAVVGVCPSPTTQ
jgi:hypothetical protein